jgi:hypothetical protein
MQQPQQQPPQQQQQPQQARLAGAALSPAQQQRQQGVGAIAGAGQPNKAGFKPARQVFSVKAGPPPKPLFKAQSKKETQPAVPKVSSAEMLRQPLLSGNNLWRTVCVSRAAVYGGPSGLAQGRR